MSAADRPMRVAAPMSAAQVSSADLLDLGELFRSARGWGYRAVLTTCDGADDVVLQSEGGSGYAVS
jgi:hypothetical protein